MQALVILASVSAAVVQVNASPPVFVPRGSRRRGRASSTYLNGAGGQRRWQSHICPFHTQRAHQLCSQHRLITAISVGKSRRNGEYLLLPGNSIHRAASHFHEPIGNRGRNHMNPM